MGVGKAARRLKQVQSFVDDHKHVLDLPSGERVSVRGSGGDGVNTILIDHHAVLAYLALEPREDAGLVLAAMGTPFEGTEREPTPRYPVLELSLPAPVDGDSEAPTMENEDIWAALYALWTMLHAQEVIPVQLASSFPLGLADALTTYLLTAGLARRGLSSSLPSILPSTSATPSKSSSSTSSRLLFLLRGAFWQGGGTGPTFSNTKRVWLRHSPSFHPFPSSPSFTRTSTVIAAHPLRAPKPPRRACVYARWCAPVSLTLSMHVIDPEDGQDMEAFHRWMNDPRVGKGWGEQGDWDHHKRYVKAVEEDPHVLAVMMCWDGERMGYTELTWIRENHVAPYVPDGVHDYDRGLHVLVGEEKFRGQIFSQAWFRSVTHYMFLSDPRTMRIIGEPKRTNPAIIKTSVDAGMHLQTFFYFPYKYSAMTMNLRERFFKEDMLS